MLNFLFKAVTFLRRCYWFIFRPATHGVKVIAISDGQVLLVKNRYDKYWYLPGGGIKRNESLLDCARREMKEECGITPKNVIMLGVFTNSREYKSDEITLVYAEVTGQDIHQGLEVEKLEFFDINHLPKNTSPATKQRIEEYISGKVIGGKW